MIDNVENRGLLCQKIAEIGHEPADNNLSLRQ